MLKREVTVFVLTRECIHVLDLLELGADAVLSGDADCSAADILKELFQFLLDFIRRFGLPGRRNTSDLQDLARGLNFLRKVVDDLSLNNGETKPLRVVDFLVEVPELFKHFLFLLLGEIRELSGHLIIN